MPPRNRQIPQEYHRTRSFWDAYRPETESLHTPRPAAPPATQTNHDRAVILPILLLLLTEGTDPYILLALLYILM